MKLSFFWFKQQISFNSVFFDCFVNRSVCKSFLPKFLIELAYYAEMDWKLYFRAIESWNAS